MGKDTPQTVYECPVCEAALPLKRMERHLIYHYSLEGHRITSEIEEYIQGLRDVINEVFGRSTSDQGNRKKSNGVRKRYFTQYWTNETWRREAERDELLDHTAGNQFRKKGVREDDEIYIITVLNGKIMLGGKIFVERIVGQKEAAKIFGVQPGDLWDAKDHIIGGDEYTYDFTPDKEVPWDVAKIVTVINSDGERGLKITPDGKGIDPQTIRGVCEINERTAKRFDELL